MIFEGEELREMITRTLAKIELRNAYGRVCRVLSSSDALALDLDLFVGLGTGAVSYFCAAAPRQFRLTPEATRRSA